MAPDAHCETAPLQGNEGDVGSGRRVLPEQTTPVQAWVEDELNRSPGENRRLLPAHKSRLQAGLKLGVHAEYPQKTLSKNYNKTKFQKRKEKLIEVLKPPYFILSMIIIMVGIHTCGSKSVSSALEWSPVTWRRQPWRVLTYGMVHASTAHLALNALVALAVGWRLEREQGWWRVLVIWWGGVCAGALGAGALQPAVKVVGASAAVYALLTAHLPNVCLRFGHIPLWWFRPLSVVVLGASEGCWALVREAPGAGGASLSGAGGAARAHVTYEHVAWAAHLLGAAVGVPLAFIVFTGENNKKMVIIASRVASVLLLAAGAGLAVYYYVFSDET